MAAAALGGGCPAKPTPRAARSTSSAATPPQSVAQALRPTSSDLDLLGEPTFQGALSTETLLRDARLLIPDLRPCTAAIAPGHTFALRLSVDDVGLLREIQYLPDDVADAGRDTCIRGALEHARVSRTMESGARAEVVLRFRAVTRAGGIAIDPTRLCSTADACVLVTGSCNEPYPVHRAHAEEVGGARRRALAATACAPLGDADVHARRLVCADGMCDTRDEEATDLRRCTTDAQCTTLVLADGRPSAFARRSAAAAAERLQAHAPTSADSVPAASCAYGVCTLGWHGAR